jgi:regulator of PEP synthase PpsR (kinase-PPPase family)
MEKELGVVSSHTMGKTHSIVDSTSYNLRIDAVNYTLAHDDGIQVQHYSEADLILAGVSRSGKTPTSLYLALQFGIKAANFPFVEEIYENMSLPQVLRPFKGKLFGLTINAERLSQIRSERRPNSQYASLEQCKCEIEDVENMFRHEKIPFLNTTFCSIEEISTRIIATSGIERKIL